MSDKVGSYEPQAGRIASRPTAALGRWRCHRGSVSGHQKDGEDGRDCRSDLE